MPRQRTAAQQLVRQFSAAGRPIYLVDDRRVIVYCNPACAAWAGVAEEELVGQTCIYGVPAETIRPSRPAAAAAARLCPPPGALTGGVSRGRVSASTSPEIGFSPGRVFAPGGRHSHPNFPPRDRRCRPAQICWKRSLSLSRRLVCWCWSIRQTWPNYLTIRAKRSICRPPNSHADLARWRHRLAGRYRLERMIGTSPAAARVRRQVSLAAAAPATY